MDTDDIQGMDHGSMQGGRAPPGARSPDYSDGYGYGSMRGMNMADDASHAMLLLDQLEYVHSDAGNGLGLDAQGWYGGDLNKAWFKADGEGRSARLEDLRVEALWDHTVAIYWDTQLGVRHDFGEGPGRTWAAFGVQGLAPYWFDVEASAYVGPTGRTAARLEVEYQILFTQRLILTPDVEINLYGRDDSARGIGSGLSNAEFGLRLRYEIRRQFAPYVGIVWNQAFGATADYAHENGEPRLDRQLVAGVRIWF